MKQNGIDDQPPNLALAGQSSHGNAAPSAHTGANVAGIDPLNQPDYRKHPPFEPNSLVQRETSAPPPLTESERALNVEYESSFVEIRLK